MNPYTHVSPSDQLLMDVLPYELFWMNAEGIVLLGNSRFYNRLSHDRKRTKPLSIYDINPGVTTKSWSDHWEEMRKKGRLHFRATHKTRKGHLYEVEIDAQFFSNNGKEWIMASVQDLGDSTFYKNLMHHTERLSRVGGWKLDLQDGSILVTAHLLRLFETEDQEDFLPGRIVEWFEEGDKLRQLLKGVIQGAQAYDEVFKLKGEPRRFFRCTAQAVLKGDKIYKVIGAYQEVTDQVEREEQLWKMVSEIRELQKQLEQENAYLQEEMVQRADHKNIISARKSYEPVLTLVERVAPTRTTVLITGESGTGKELLAASIHALSDRSDRPLIKVNCATIPKELFESELFGHRKGAFTGAVDHKVGKFTLAHGGTIFLDEIGELPLDLQPKLLRVLQEGEFDEVGGKETQKVDVRVIAATNRDLKAMVSGGSFREDLFYRLNVFPIHNLPLRERREDIPLLAQFFLEKYSARAGKRFNRLSKNTLRYLEAYDFPGNIRELENLIERAVIIEEGPILQPGAWIPRSETTAEKRTVLSLEEAQRQHILMALERTGGRVSGKLGAARLLQVKDKTLFAKMKRLGIEKNTLFK